MEALDVVRSHHCTIDCEEGNWQVLSLHGAVSRSFPCKKSPSDPAGKTLPLF